MFSANPCRLLIYLKVIMKPTMNLESDDDGYTLIERAATKLFRFGLREEAGDLIQRASIRGYNFNHVLKLLKEYMTI